MPVLQFKGKTFVENHHLTVKYHQLIPNEEASLTDKVSLQDNLIIHGDNLIALKALMPLYRGKVKCIYIDPPYNTGEEGWVYNDNVNSPMIQEWVKQNSPVDKEDLTRHDKWLCMMMPRLRLLHELLRDDGVMFISIDDNEIHQLRMLMDEIFGIENFVATFIWEKRTTRENRRVFSFNHDYIICFAKKKDLFGMTRNLLPLTEEALNRYSNPDNDSRGVWQSVSLAAQAGHATPAQFYTITTPSGREVNPPSGNCWRFTEQRLKELIADNRIWFGKDGDNVPRRKVFLSEVNQGLTPSTFWKADEVGTTDTAKKSLNDLFDGETVFDTPKPIGLLKRIIQISTSDDDIVLDSFAGSGTTAQAVLELNAKDESDRRVVTPRNWTQNH